MVAKFGFYRAVGLQERAAKDRPIERADHRTLLKLAEIPAIAPGRAFRVTLRQMIKADAALQLDQDLLSQFLFFYQNMQGCCGLFMVLLYGLNAISPLYH